jgi:hypothetical protein
VAGVTKEDRNTKMKKKSNCCGVEIIVSGGRGFPLTIICSKCWRTCKVKRIKRRKNAY